ncbi:MAG TPA: hypothetical protein VGM50_19015, partial [Gemmatimonadaceae bacterium]
MYTRLLVFVSAVSMNGSIAAPTNNALQRTLPPRTPQRAEQYAEQRADVRDLLASARGVAAPLCVLASDGAANWGGGWDAPELSVQGDARAVVRDLRNTTLSDADAHVLVDALG